MMLLPLLALGFLVYFLVYRKDSGTIVINGNELADEQLRKRFVRGEIDEQTYLHMKETMSQ